MSTGSALICVVVLYANVLINLPWLFASVVAWDGEGGRLWDGQTGRHAWHGRPRALDIGHVAGIAQPNNHGYVRCCAVFFLCLFVCLFVCFCFGCFNCCWFGCCCCYEHVLTLLLLSMFLGLCTCFGSIPGCLCCFIIIYCISLSIFCVLASAVGTALWMAPEVLGGSDDYGQVV